MTQRLTRRILLITWKWRCLNDYKINTQYLEKINIDDFLNDFCQTQKKHSLYKTLRVGGFKTSSEDKEIDLYSDFQIEKGARVICCNIYKGKKPRKVLHHLIEIIHQKYSKNGDKVEIMLFLHRGHHYNYKDVLHFLEKKGEFVRKCFLFEAGQDFIYYQTEKKGFLDEFGRFYKGWKNEGEENEEFVKTYHMIENKKDKENKEKVIDTWYFNNVWEYYQQEFKQKFKNLYVDFINTLIHLKAIHSDEGVEKKDFIKYLKKRSKFSKKSDSKLIYYRIKSFLGSYDNIELEINPKTKKPINQKEYDQLKDEREAIGNFEKIHKQSYTFDDVRANLKHKHEDDTKDIEAHNIYTNLYQLMEPLFLTKVKYDKKINKQDIRSIRDEMEKLIKILPGDNI